MVGGRNNYPDLIKELALTDFKLRYNNSILGYFWSLLNPLLLFGVLYIVFSLFLRYQVENYKIYLLFGIILWAFFTESTINAMRSLFFKSNLIKKIYFPRWIIIISSNLTTLVGFLLNLVVFLIFYFLSGLGLNLHFLYFFPYFIFLCLIISGCSFFLSSMFIRYRDMEHIWTVLVQVGFWVTPIIYPLSMIPEKYHFYILLNPLARILFDVRNAIIYGIDPSLISILIAFISSIIVFLIGYLIFKKSSYKFAEWV